MREPNRPHAALAEDLHEDVSTDAAAAGDPVHSPPV
jgi:hypothetical protein